MPLSRSSLSSRLDGVGELSVPGLFVACALAGGVALMWMLVGGTPAALVAGYRALPGPWPPVRSLVGFAMAFGLAGLLASWLELYPAMQLAFALLSGLAVGGLTAFALRLYGRHRELTGQALIGQTGQVLVSPDGPDPGWMLLTAKDEKAHLPVTSRDRLLPGDRVQVIAELGGLLDVRRCD